MTQVVKPNIPQARLHQQRFVLTGDDPGIEWRTDSAGEYEAGVLPAASGGKPCFELAHAMRSQRGCCDHRQSDCSVTPRRFQLSDLHASFDLDESDSNGT